MAPEAERVGKRHAHRPAARLVGDVGLASRRNTSGSATTSLAAEGLVSDGEIIGVSQATASWHVKGPAAWGLRSWPVSSHWDLYGRAGAVWAQTDATFTVEDFIVSERAKAKETTTELLWGIGAAYHPNRQWTLRFGA